MTDGGAGSPALSAAGLRFGYGRGRLFDGLDLSMKAGEMVALIGPNGSGKTTLLKLLCGALAPKQGEVALQGRSVRELPARDRARLVAVVPQESRMTFDFTVLETVLMGRTAYLGLLGVEGPEDLAAAHEALERTGTREFAGRLLSELSGGERQLVLIARALAQRPRVLLADEPTAFLDVRHRLEIYDLMASLNAGEGLTIVTTSHDINTAARYCPRIVLLQRGRVRADGPPEHVFTPEILSDVYGTPLRVFHEPETGIPWAAPPPRISRGPG